MQQSSAAVKRTATSSTDNSVDDVLYAQHKKVYPRGIDGRFARLRLLGMTVLLGLFYSIAWLSWDGRQAVLLDLPARKFYIFGLTFWPQDFFFFAWLLVIAALSLFFFTALAGRLWCGYACPQTVWTELFLWIERKIEGSRNRQIKRDKAGWSVEKIRVKTVKHTLWIALSLYTGFTFVGYFTPIRQLSVSLMQFSLGPWETFWVLFYGFATYGNAGWLREQVCIYMCPYARFQSAMFDQDTLVISYDAERGEPRGPRKRGVDPASLGLGDCIDCTLCVQVCPTGIDIRDGLQYQCIGCAACIDACDEVMDKMGYPRGLIRYTTENVMAGIKTRLARPRIIMYMVVLAALSIGLVYAIIQRVPLELDIIRDRNVLYRETPEGLVENVYTLKLINMDKHSHPFELRVSGLKDLKLKLESPVIEVPAGNVRSLPVSVQVDPVVLDRASNTIEFTLRAVDDPSLSRTETARFLGPVTR